MDLKQYVLETVNVDAYYSSRFDKWNSKTRGNVLCPWHQDTNPSLSIGLKNGGARCHACGERIGNIVHFEAKACSISENQAAIDIYAEFIRPIIPQETVASLQKCLNSNASVSHTVARDTGFTEESCDLLQLGWEGKHRRLVFPIFDRWNNCINLRLYRLPSHRKASEAHLKIINAKGYGGCDLFSWPLFCEFDIAQPVFVMPSEKEMVLGIQEGLQAVCATAGELAWPESATPMFKGFKVCIVAQRDDVGRKAAAKRAEILSTVAECCVVIEPPTEHKDFADFVVLDGGTGIALLAAFKLATSQKAVEIKHENPDLFSSETGLPRLPSIYSSEQVELAALSSNPSLLNQICYTRGIVAAKATITYTIPWKFKVKCKGDIQRYYSMELGRHLLAFVKLSDKGIALLVNEILDKEDAQIEAVDFVNVTEVEVIPVVAVDRDMVYVTQRCMFIGPRIEANVPYELQIIPTNTVQTQETLGIIINAVPISRALEIRTFSDEDIATLQTFQPTDDETVMSKLQSLATNVSDHYSKIYNRPDWHIVAMLTWLSPIGFAFPFEKEPQRGWINSLAVGDTQTGKSKVVQTLQKLFNAGTIISAENCTYVGLVGGAIKMGSGQFMLRWGRIPLSDKQLVVVEELSGLSVEEISRMSDVRSSGVARLDKGGLSAETTSRTRLLALSNVRPVNKTLASYLSGVQAVRELIGHGEDIARFDLISTLVDREVSVDIINRPFSSKGLKNAIPESSFEKLCQFVWSLKPEQIKITTDAYYAVLEQTKRLAEIYHAAVPIFKGGSGRYKIARIAAAIACMQFSWNGKYIMVTEDHIEASANLLEMLYNKESFGYLEFSQQMLDREGVKNKDTLNDKFSERIPNTGKRNSVIETLIHSSKFTRDELCAVASLQIMAADDLIGVMVRERVLRKGEANVWEITPAGRDWMKIKMQDDPLTTT